MFKKKMMAETDQRRILVPVVLAYFPITLGEEVRRTKGTIVRGS